MPETSRELLLDAAAKHIAERLAITHAFAERKLKQYLMERAIKGGAAVTDADIPELAEEVVKIELSEYGSQVTARQGNKREPINLEDAPAEPGLVSPVHYRDLQRENAVLRRENERLRSERRELTEELTRARTLADTYAGEIEGLRSSVEIITGELLKRVGPVALPVTIHNEVTPR